MSEYDSMTPRQLVEELELLDEVATNIGRENNDLLIKIAELESKLADREWVSVEDRLPENMSGQLVVAYENDCSSGVICCHSYLDHIGFCIYQRGIESGAIVGVTHWQPLPPLPEGKP